VGDVTEVRLTDTIPGDTDVVVLGWYRDPSRPTDSAVSSGLGVDLARAVNSTPWFTGHERDDPLVVPSVADGTPAVVVVPLGTTREAGADNVRHAVQRAAATTRGQRNVALVLPADVSAAGAEGFLLGAYSSPRAGRAAPASPGTQTLVVVANPVPGLQRDLQIAEVSANQANWVRRLVETPAGDLGPTELATVLTTAADAVGIEATVWSTDQLRQRGFGAVLAVGQGSHRAPCVVELVLGSSSPSVLGLVGKGVVFDSGGINLKRNPAEIAWMKSDMAGAVSCAGAMIAAARLGATGSSTRSVRAVLPLVENMPGGGALRPGDVVQHPNGVRTEVTDTDCEGRLIVADGLAHLVGNGAKEVIDVATLTDAAGFGPALWAAATTDDALCAEVLSAGRLAGDPGWQIPIPASYATLLESPVADGTNAAVGVPDSTVIAATFLRGFVGATPWVHIDNGSTAYLERPWQGWPAGATGSPTRALTRFLLDRLS
jgi:leucyl aminopeptidase